MCAPLLQFVEEFRPRLESISLHMVADPRPSGGSMFRIYRDVRFAKDKSPYKTNAALHFRHAVGRDVHGPGYYIRLEPGGAFGGGGMWRPDQGSLARLRGAIDGQPGEWPSVRPSGRLTLGGDTLKRPPRGYDPGHPLIDDLKRKNFVASAPYTEAEVTESGFIDRYEEDCRVMAPFMEFLAHSVGLSW